MPRAILLAALLRANGIPAGLCYQRLSINGEGAPYCLHGLNAVYLNSLIEGNALGRSDRKDKAGWYRIDARGNKAGVNAQFSPPQEQLAFSTGDKLEGDLQGIWPEPLPIVTQVLEQQSSCMGVYENLPDVDVF